MNRPASPPRPLADVLADPDTEWSDIRQALKSHGRPGSFRVGRRLAATTNAGVVKALSESVAKGRRSSSVTAASSDEDDGEEDFSGCDGSKLDGSSGGVESSSSKDGPDQGKGADASTHHDVCTGGREAVASEELPRNNSAKGTSLRGGLEDVLEDSEVDKEDLNSFGSSEDSSAGRRIPTSQVSRGGSARGTFGKVPAKKSPNDRLPARRLMRNGSAKGASFRGSLKNVLEDVEADMDDAGSENDGRASEESRDGQLRSLARRLPRSGPGRGPSFRMNSMKSIRLFNSNSSFSSASLESDDFNESINIMDFGCDPNQRAFTRSMMSVAASSRTSTSDSYSNLVDSEGFLHWKDNVSKDNDSSSSLSIDYNPSSKRAQVQSKRSDSMRTADLVDSDGFLGWEDRMNDSSSRVLSSIADSAEDDAAANHDENASELDEIKEATKLAESWRIEDYENDHEPPPKPSGSGSALSKQMRHLTSKVTGGLSALKNTNDTDMPTEPIKTNDIKHMLLNGRSSQESLTNENATRDGAGTSSLRNSAFKAFVARRRSSGLSDYSDGDDYDSRPAIRINCEDGADIEALYATRSDGTKKGRLKMGFF